jgi:hypothetical protein
MHEDGDTFLYAGLPTHDKWLHRLHLPVVSKVLMAVVNFSYTNSSTHQELITEHRGRFT